MKSFSILVFFLCVSFTTTLASANEHAIALNYTMSPVENELSVVISNTSNLQLDAIELHLQAGMVQATDSSTIDVGTLAPNETKSFTLSVIQVYAPDLPAVGMDWQATYTSNGMQYSQVISSASIGL